MSKHKVKPPAYSTPGWVAAEGGEASDVTSPLRIIRMFQPSQKQPDCSSPSHSPSDTATNTPVAFQMGLLLLCSCTQKVNYATHLAESAHVVTENLCWFWSSGLWISVGAQVCTHNLWLLLLQLNVKELLTSRFEPSGDVVCPRPQSWNSVSQSWYAAIIISIERKWSFTLKTQQSSHKHTHSALSRKLFLNCTEM